MIIIYSVKAYVSSSAAAKANKHTDRRTLELCLRNLGYKMKYKLPQPRSKDLLTTVAKNQPVTIKQNVMLENNIN